MVTLAGMVAIPTTGYWRIYELCCYAVLSLLSINETLFETFDLLLHLGQLVFITVIGSGFVIQEGLSLQILHAQRED